MPNLSLEASQEGSRPLSLRQQAEQRLSNGTTGCSSQGTHLGADALAVLYKLASSPDGAAEGLKLLHELQTYQVEVDLQNEQLAISAQVSAKLGSYYQALFDSAPLGYLVTGLDGKIVDSNFAAAQLFGLPVDELNGCCLEHLIKPEYRAPFSKQLKQLGTNMTWVVKADATLSCRLLQLHVRIATGGMHLLIQVIEVEPATRT